MFLLDQPIANGPLAQGEIISNLVQYRIDTPPLPDQEVIATPVEHAFALVLTQVCDLQHDFKARFHARPEMNVHRSYVDTPKKYLLEAVLLCKVDKEDAFREPERGINASVFKDVQKNQHERYHCLGPLRAHDGAAGTEYRLFLDFKRLWLCPPEALYAAIHASPANHRQGIIPSPFLEDLMQRFHAFHGRVGVPDSENDIQYKMAALPPTPIPYPAVPQKRGFLRAIRDTTARLRNRGG